MENLLRNTTALAKLICDQYVNENSAVIDATCGNGHDTLYYAKKCRYIYCFDIQKEAICNTEKLLSTNNCSNYELINTSHEKMDEYVFETVDLIMFNLGYLPNTNKKITTLKGSTLIALEKSLKLLNINGVICIVIYYGHENGKIEREAVLKFSEELDSRIYHTVYLTSPNQSNCPPEIVLITRKK